MVLLFHAQPDYFPTIGFEQVRKRRLFENIRAENFYGIYRQCAGRHFRHQDAQRETLRVRVDYVDKAIEQETVFIEVVENFIKSSNVLFAEIPLANNLHAVARRRDEPGRRSINRDLQTWTNY